MRTAARFAFAALLVPSISAADPETQKADAELQKQVAKTNSVCGSKITASIDWASWKVPLEKKTTAPQNIGSRDLCGAPLSYLENFMCTDDAGKAAARTITSYRCNTVGEGTTDPKHSLTNGVLTFTASIYADGMWQTSFVEERFPDLHAGRVIPGILRDKASDWKEATKDYAPGLALEVDAAAYTAIRYPTGLDRCIDDLRAIVEFLGKTHQGENKKGQLLLKKLKHAVCSVGNEPSATVKGDTLTYKMQAAGKVGGPFAGDPEGYAWGYNQLRATEKLGGQCSGAVMGDAYPACEKAKGGMPKRPKAR